MSARYLTNLGMYDGNLGITPTKLSSLVSFERKVAGGYIDVFMEDAGVLVEQKASPSVLTERFTNREASGSPPSSKR